LSQEACLREYNQERPHGSLEGLTPFQFFEASEKQELEQPDGQAEFLTQWLVPVSWACQ
jgi:hypothetical protein